MEKWIEEIASDITIESLPEAYRILADAIGLPATIQAAPRLSGLELYFPKVGRLLEQKRNDMIRREFNGGNYRHLATKYGLTERWVRNIVHEKPIEQSQMNLFE
ncbi:MAG: hypothetical protein LLF89_04330 [Spirochaetaceae bacterium]|nr:hypothetical protein [Spirochaetaceae bacterium]